MQIFNIHEKPVIIQIVYFIDYINDNNYIFPLNEELRNSFVLTYIRKGQDK